MVLEAQLEVQPVATRVEEESAPFGPYMIAKRNQRNVEILIEGRTVNPTSGQCVDVATTRRQQ